MQNPKLTELEVARLEAITEQLRARAAAEFFSDPGLPAELQKDLHEGWAVLQERKRERMKAGVPLPPGGCMILGERSVVAQCLAEFHNSLARVLGVEAGAVRLRWEKRGVETDHVSSRIVADVALPEGWPAGAGQLAELGAGCFGVRKEDPDYQHLIEDYLRVLMHGLNELYQRDVRLRISQVRTVRSELVPLDLNGVSWAEPPLSDRPGE